MFMQVRKNIKFGILKFNYFYFIFFLRCINNLASCKKVNIYICVPEGCTLHLCAMQFCVFFIVKYIKRVESVHHLKETGCHDFSHLKCKL